MTSMPLHPRGIRADEDEVEDFFRQVLAAHWDLAACFCPVCYVGRALGFRPGDIDIAPEMEEFAGLLLPFDNVARPLTKNDSTTGGDAEANSPR